MAVLELLLGVDGSLAAQAVEQAESYECAECKDAQDDDDGCKGGVGLGSVARVWEPAGAQRGRGKRFNGARSLPRCAGSGKPACSSPYFHTLTPEPEPESESLESEVAVA